MAEQPWEPTEEEIRETIREVAMPLVSWVELHGMEAEGQAIGRLYNRKLVEYIENMGRCKGGLAHYCPNCDNSLIALNENAWKQLKQELGIKEE